MNVRGADKLILDLHVQSIFTQTYLELIAKTYLELTVLFFGEILLMNLDIQVWNKMRVNK